MLVGGSVGSGGGEPSGASKLEPKLDRAALKDAVMAGEDVPGAVKTNGTVSLTIRRL